MKRGICADNEETQIRIGRIIRKHRKQQLKSIEGLAWNTGMNDKYLGDIEHGIYSISSYYLLKLHAEEGLIDLMRKENRYT